MIEKYTIIKSETIQPTLQCLDRCYTLFDVLLCMSMPNRLPFSLHICIVILSNRDFLIQHFLFVLHLHLLHETFTLLIIFIVKSLQREQNSWNLLLWPPICRNIPAITPKWFNTLTLTLGTWQIGLLFLSTGEWHTFICVLQHRSGILAVSGNFSSF